MLCPFHHVRSHYFLAVLTLVGLVCWPSIGLTYEGTRFIPQFILLVDESGSMSGRHAWLEEFVPALGQALAERNEFDLPADIEFTVVGFTDDTRKLLLHESTVEATDAVKRLRTNRGGTEDGYVAIRDVLQRRPFDFGRPTTVILVSDENRDVTDPDVTLSSLSEYLLMRGIVVHSIIPAEILCPGRKAGIAIDQHKVALQPGVSRLSTCEDADSWIHRDYAELAWTSGGLTWDLAVFGSTSRRQASSEVVEQFVAGLSGWILRQWPATLSARVEISPAEPRAGDIVTFDASGSFTNEPGRQISSWTWDFDGDGAADERGATISRILSSGRYRISLDVTDNATPPATSRKILHLHIAD